MVNHPAQPAECRIANLFGPCRPALAACALFSAFVNLLTLTGPLFMLQVYDRVLPARSGETLVVLFILVIFLFAVMAMADVARTRILARCGDHLQDQIDPAVFPALLAPLQPGQPPASAALLRDVDVLRRAIAAPVTLALMDLPWLPFFLGALCLLHPLLGLLAFCGGAVLAMLAWAAHRRIRALTQTAAQAGGAADRASIQFLRRPDEVAAFGMLTPATRRWLACRRHAATAEARLADAAGLAAATTRATRLLLQSAMLALATWLFLQGQVSAGAMSAASILMGRALAPVEALIAGWPLAERALAARRRLTALWSQDATSAPMALPAPTPRLDASDLTVSAPGSARAILHGISIALQPGQILGILGPSGAGKSALARTLAGLWPPATGDLRLDHVHLHQFAPAARAAFIGYLPQTPCLFDGTIAENIARLHPAPDSATVIAAARAAGAHEMIAALPDGYETRLDCERPSLSGGQLQRIALARAVFGNPVLLILDEPDAALDAEGALALSQLLRRHRAAGGSVILTAHRQALVRDCDLLLALDSGRVRASGPRDAVLKSLGLALPIVPRALPQPGRTHA